MAGSRAAFEEVATIVGNATSGCAPVWSREAKPCPYGTAIWLPLAGFTLPFELSVANAVACLYSLLPFVGMVVNVVLVARRRRPRELCWLLFAFSLVLVNETIRSLMSEPRPDESCLSSCGMPSGHACYAVGLFIFVPLWDSVSRSIIDEDQEESPRKSLHAGILAVVLLPITWSRVQLGDHYPQQVLMGAGLGAIGATVWLLCVGPCCEAFLEQVMRRVRREILPDQPAIAAAAGQREPVLDRSLLGPTLNATELSGDSREPKPQGGFWGVVVEDGEMPLHDPTVFS